jgi:hypothetical protein
MEKISSFFLMGYAQRSRPSFFNTCMKYNSLFWPINVEIRFNTKTRLQAWPGCVEEGWIFHGCVEEGCSATHNHVHSPWEKNLKSFPFNMVLSWKQCSCDVIIERMNCENRSGIIRLLFSRHFYNKFSVPLYLSVGSRYMLEGQKLKRNVDS